MAEQQRSMGQFINGFFRSAAAMAVLGACIGIGISVGVLIYRLLTGGVCA